MNELVTQGLRRKAENSSWGLQSLRSRVGSIEAQIQQSFTRRRTTVDYLVQWVVVKIMVPFWVLSIIRHQVLTQQGTIILTTAHTSH